MSDLHSMICLISSVCIEIICNSTTSHIVFCPHFVQCRWPHSCSVPHHLCQHIASSLPRLKQIGGGGEGGEEGGGGGDAPRYRYICFPSKPALSQLELGFSGLTMWHFLKLVVGGFLRVFRFPPPPPSGNGFSQ